MFKKVLFGLVIACGLVFSTNSIAQNFNELTGKDVVRAYEIGHPWATNYVSGVVDGVWIMSQDSSTINVCPGTDIYETIVKKTVYFIGSNDHLMDMNHRYAIVYAYIGAYSC